MKPTRILAIAAVALAAVVSGHVANAADAPAAPQAQKIAPDIWLIPGGFPPRREPDGNTTILVAPKGLIVFDTGRHVWHTQAIEAFAQARHAPIVAIFNSHWHLDHTSGNLALKRAHPEAKVYASEAIRDALKGFLPNSVKDDRDYLASGQAAPETAEDIRGDIAVIENGAALIPDVPIKASRTMTVGGRRLEVHLARGAATAGDVWVYDARRRTAISNGVAQTSPRALLQPAGQAVSRKGAGSVTRSPTIAVRRFAS